MKNSFVFTLFILLVPLFSLNEVSAKVFEEVLGPPQCPIVSENQCACEKGIQLSVTVYFRGIDKFNSNEDEFRRLLRQERDTANINQNCCKNIFLTPEYDHNKDIKENGQIISKRINQIIGDVTEGIKSVNIHLVGFSTGGLIAIETANNLNLEIESQDRMWCNTKLPNNIPIEIDIVTIATPYGGGGNSLGNWGPKIGEGVCRVIGIDQVLSCSVGSQDYGGISAPPNLCGFTALVTERIGDTTAGGPKHIPDPNHLGEGWNPDIISIGEINHSEAVLEARRSNQYLFNPNCGCNTQNSKYQEVLQKTENFEIQQSSIQISPNSGECIYPKSGDIKAPILERDNTIAAPEFSIFTIVITLLITFLIITVIRRDVL